MSIARATVPCGTCRACCKGELVSLHPEDGDRVETYQHDIHRVGPGEFLSALRRQPNGDCVYLGETGCSIWDRAPVMCRVFDCRRHFKNLVKRFGLKGLHMDDVMRAGRDRAKPGTGNGTD